MTHQTLELAVKDFESSSIIIMLKDVRENLLERTKRKSHKKTETIKKNQTDIPEIKSSKPEIKKKKQKQNLIE